VRRDVVVVIVIAVSMLIGAAGAKPVRFVMVDSVMTRCFRSELWQVAARRLDPPGRGALESLIAGVRLRRS